MSADLATRMNADAAADTEHSFVINLCASTSPMALSHPNTPELKRYTFFVSRQREDGRERFRLHMGYFASQEEAEALLAAVRDVYPAAWAGPAPTTGVPRRARMSVAPTVTVTPRAAVPAAAAPAAAAPAPAAAASVPAAPNAAKPVVAAAVAPAPVAAPPAKNPSPANQPAAAPGESLDDMSNVRDVLAQLSETAPRLEAAAKAVPAQGAVQAPAAPVARAPAPELDASQTLSVLESASAASSRATPEPAAPRAAAPAAPTSAPAPAPAAARAAASAQAPAPVAAPPRAPAKARPASRANGADDGQVRIVTPEDTQTLTDIRLDAENNAPPCFAVQLVWAVAPIDVTSLPHLAIFDAYTLYNVEGSRQGRKWFGLRLGFFSDPNSATQVAHYVRSDYPAVAVVPVATRERDHAKGGIAPAAPRAAAAPLRAETALSIEKEGLNGFELLPDDAPRATKRDVDDIGAQQQPAAAPPAPDAASMTAREKIAAAAAGKPLVKPAAPVVQPVAGKATGKPSGKRVVVRKRPPSPMSSRAAPGAPNPLESTLDILGASTLTLDESREIVNDSAIRKPIEKKTGSRFSKLLSRLSGG